MPFASLTWSRCRCSSCTWPWWSSPSRGSGSSLSRPCRPGGRRRHPCRCRCTERTCRLASGVRSGGWAGEEGVAPIILLLDGGTGQRGAGGGGAEGRISEWGAYALMCVLGDEERMRAKEPRLFMNRRLRSFVSGYDCVFHVGMRVRSYLSHAVARGAFLPPSPCSTPLPALESHLKH